MKNISKIKLVCGTLLMCALFGLFLVLGPHSNVKAATSTTAESSSSNGLSGYASSVTLYITNAKDSKVGLHSTPYCFQLHTSSSKPSVSNCSWQSSSSKTYTDDYNGYGHLWVRNANSENKYLTWYYVRVDGTDPTLTVSGTSTSWTTGSRTLTLKGSDSKSGVTGYYCNGSWKSSTSSSYSCTITSEGKTASVGVEDKAGNRTYQDANVYIDGTSPSLSVTGTSTSWTTGSRTLTLKGTDNGSGVAYYYCNGSWKSSTASSYSCTVTTEGQTATVGVKDASGQQTTQSVNVYIDKASPTASISSSSTTWTTSAQTVTLSASDTVGLATYPYCFLAKTTTTEPGNSTCSWQSSKTYSASTSGTTYVHGYAKDVAGNITYASYATTKIDSTAPTYTSISGGGATYTKSVTITVNGASDAASGLASSPYCFVKSTSTSKPSTTTSCWQSGATYTQSTTYSGYVHVFIKDTAGNSIYASYKQLAVDADIPTLSYDNFVETANIDLVNNKFSIRFVPGDAKSGVKTVTLTNSGTYTSSKATFPISSISDKKISFSYTITDNAGNQKTGTLNISTVVTYDDTLNSQIKNGLDQKLETNTKLTPVSEGRQLSYTINQEAEALINNLIAFDIDVSNQNLGLKFVFVSSELNEDLSTYDDLSRKAALSQLQTGLVSPLGQKQKK